MDVPVDDHDPFAPCRQGRGGDGDVVEQAEPLTARAWSRDGPAAATTTNAESALVARELVDRGQPAADGPRGGGERAGRDHGVGIEPAAALRANSSSAST